ncbi:MAG: hypothetical protein NTZ39_09950 [Methanoregula sp.]|nr:hypothetical protein [Methanoregula sp.]
MQITTSTKPSNRAYLPLILAGILIGAVLIAGCTTQPAPAGTPSAPVSTGSVSIGEIVKDPAAYEGKEVVMKGKITNECGSGCWFMLEDGTGLIYVDLAPNNFAIPQLQGATVVVKGVIHVAKGDPTLTAATVATGARTYP